MKSTRELIVQETNRALWYEDGKLVRELGPGRYEYPRQFLLKRSPRIHVVLVDIRERELTIKGQEILTADKVSLRVSILVQFRVTDPKAAIQHVESYEDRLYSDVQLAARRSLASMPLDEILTNRNKLSEDILVDVKETAASYGVAIRRADVKDLIFPGNLQEIMNQVLAAQRQSEAKLVQARTQAEMERLQAETQAQIRLAADSAAIETQRLRREMEIQTDRLQAEADTHLLTSRETMAQLLEKYPTLLRLLELEGLQEIAKNSNARIYLGLDRPNGNSATRADKS